MRLVKPPLSPIANSPVLSLVSKSIYNGWFRVKHWCNKVICCGFTGMVLKIYSRKTNKHSDSVAWLLMAALLTVSAATLTTDSSRGVGMSKNGRICNT